MQNFILGYDGTETAKAALEVAKEQVTAFGGKIHIVQSLIGGDDTSVDDVNKAEEDLEYAKRYFESLKIPCETHLLIRGLPAGEDIVQFAKEYSAYEVIVGVRRRSKVGKLMFGSTAQYVILEATCPVLTVK